MKTRIRHLCVMVICVVLSGHYLDAAHAGLLSEQARIRCANLIYAGSKSSVCFSGKFLQTAITETSLTVEPEFIPVRLDSETIYDHPFAIMTGEGTFTLTGTERANLRDYLLKGGFLLASAGCSSKEWDKSFRSEMNTVFPDIQFVIIPMDHAIFRTVYQVDAVKLKRSAPARLEGLIINGRIVLVYSAEGLNDTSSVKGCCCCGGNEVSNSHEINVNIFTYAVMH